ncbi:MAG: cation diffusion facilitator family transporter [Acidobacteriota bacterium]|nr:cation diffusion facilitator family transporter [Acidobacteriota bacterium]
MSMTATPAHAPASKRSVALWSVLAALVVTTLKLVTGILTGSLGMLSEAAHSAVDLLAATITLLSVRVSDRPADDVHNYGHGKVEALSAFVETVIMLASSFWIITEALRRILFRQHLILPLTIWPFLVLLLSIVVDYSRSRALHRAAQHHASDALEADAIHFSTDIWSSTAVLLGLAATFAGQHWHLAALELADPLAAIVVSILIVRISLALGRRTVHTLIDASPAQTADGLKLRRAMISDLAAIPGVLAVNRLRIRRSGPSYFADVTLSLPRNFTFQRTEQLTLAASLTVQRHLTGADVIVHTIPTAYLAESVHDRIRAVAARVNLAIHDVTVQQFDDGLHVELHLEVTESMPLREAHALVTLLETDIREEVPEITNILTHIESEPATIERPSSLDRDRQLEERLRRTAAAFPLVLDIHEVLVTRHGGTVNDHASGRIQVSCHCTLPDDLPMAEVHAVISALEDAFKVDSPEVSRLLIHPEPSTDNRR